MRELGTMPTAPSGPDLAFPLLQVPDQFIVGIVWWGRWILVMTVHSKVAIRGLDFILAHTDSPWFRVLRSS